MQFWSLLTPLARPLHWTCTGPEHSQRGVQLAAFYRCGSATSRVEPDQENMSHWCMFWCASTPWPLEPPRSCHKKQGPETGSILRWQFLTPFSIWKKKLMDPWEKSDAKVNLFLVTLEATSARDLTSATFPTTHKMAPGNYPPLFLTLSWPT